MLFVAQLCRSVAEFSEALGIAGVEVGVGEDVLDRGDFRFEMLDLAGQAVEIALVLVAELG